MDPYRRNCILCKDGNCFFPGVSVLGVCSVGVFYVVIGVLEMFLIFGLLRVCSLECLFICKKFGKKYYL